jgi:ribonuclease HI
MSNKLVIACDGSCLKNPGGEIGWAWADNKGRWQSNGAATGSNQRAELLGLLSVFYAFPNTSMHLQLDSQYVLNIATKWMFTWKKNGWYRDAEKTQVVSNLNYVQAIYEALRVRKQKKLVTTFEWVKGHAANGLNNIADKEAQAAARRIKAGKPGYADSAKNTSSERQNRMLESL